MSEQIVYIFWTGGWDSTFRLLQLAEMDINIQPFYIVDAGRIGKKYEIGAMASILHDIREREGFKANVFDIQEYKVEEITRDKEIIDAYLRLKEKYNIGSQYQWLAEFCKYKNLNQVEIGVVNEQSTIMDAIWTEGGISEIESFISGTKALDMNISSSDLKTIFRYYVFGLANVSKKDIEIIAREKGWISIMKKTWFCHMPVHGKPCGICNPCRDAMSEGMEWRMPYSSRFRYNYMDNRIGRKLIGLERHIMGY